MAEPVEEGDGHTMLSMVGHLMNDESSFADSSPTTAAGAKAHPSTVPRKLNFDNSLSTAGDDSTDPSVLSQDVSDDPEDKKHTRVIERPETPQTPRANSSTNVRFNTLTDTILAKHIQSIHVPDTVARDFSLRNPSPTTRPASSGGLGGSTLQDRPRKALTLKEQNTKLDKLTKENFDLKLKIHFLDEALQTRSEDGIKELIEKNVQLQTDLANERKESQHMRRKMREMERKIKEQEQALAQARATKNSKHNDNDDDDDDPTLQAEMHEEILYLRQQLDYSENQVTALRDEVMTKELEKRKMAEHMRNMADKRGEDTAGVKETMDMWQDLLNAEAGRREQAEEDIGKLRDELHALRLERGSPTLAKTNKKRGRLGVQQNFGDDTSDEFLQLAEDTESQAVIGQLKHENAELRRDLGAQTSMLTSRNRERERLQQEIEDLKLLHRKGDARSVAGESIFDRSISRAHQRSQSRASDHTQVTEAERDEWERKEGQLRDSNAELRMKYQELDRTHTTYLQYVSALEGDFTEMEKELDECREDLVKMQTERDETLRAVEEMEADYAQLKEEALAEIQALDEEKKMLEVDLDEAQAKLQKTMQKLQTTADDYKGLQGELRQITQSVMNLEDLKQHNMRTIQTLEQQITETEDELQKWEQKCNELDQKNRKLEVTEESLHNEITFLREEQEGDKIKIGELEGAISAAHQTIQDEQEKLRELEASILEERQQRDVLENKSKGDVQKVLDDLNSENTKAKDETRKLRRELSAKEVEARNWKQKLDELQNALRGIMGNRDGTKQSLLADIEKLQRDLETTANELDRAKMDLSDKDRLLRHRDGLLESTSLESRRLSDLLEKERTSRRRDLDQYEKQSRGQAANLRTIAQQETRVAELETTHNQDKRKFAALEQQYRDQLLDRNNLLLALWNRLSTLCGSDWAQNHSLVNGELPSTEVIGKHLNSFNKNIIAAVKTIEGLIGSFKVRIRGIEKDLWRDYQTLEHNLDMRIKRMDGLETAVKDTQKAIVDDTAHRPQAGRSVLTKNPRNSEELAKLKSEIKLLKAELKFHRQHPSPMAQQMLNQQAQMNPDQSRRQSISASPARQIMNQLLRHHSTSSSAVEHPQLVQDSPGGGDEIPNPQHQPQSQQTQTQPILLPNAPPPQLSEQRWVHRLKELERRLKAEREARLLDRHGARQRIQERDLENDQLRLMLERGEGGLRRRGSARSGLGGSVAVSSRAESQSPSEGGREEREPLETEE